ncbi:MAG TPA: HEAT repeat domain-containing protein, partial [Parachlamydiaceae bacterium]|nr:HEAT repeat domain-containing protein [Parachlamydiaceae bacterium]
MTRPSHEQQSTATNHILYLMHTGETAKALQAYQEYRNTTGTNDFELIEQIGLIILDQGYRSKDAEIQRLTLFGAGVSTNEKALYILEEGMSSNDQENQLIALNFLARFHNDRADLSIQRAMGSNSLLVRLETAFKLSKRKDPKAVGQTEALMAKVPEQVWPIFPQIYAECGSPEAKKILRKLLTHKDEAVRISTILSLAEYGHDDFLPHIRRMMSHHGAAQQEACATALGLLKDENSAKSFMILAKSSNANVKLAALASLYRLGRHESAKEVEAIANQGNIFAIYLLGDMPGSEDALARILQSNQLQIKINAAVALLNLGDKRSLPIVAQLLLRDTRDIALGKISSQGTSLTALKVVPSAQQNFEDDPVAIEVSLHLREELLVKAVELPEKDFLSLAHALLDCQQGDLIPILAEVLENHPTAPVIELLKRHQQKVGAPLIRNYCNLTLYRIKEPGPYAQNLLEWVKQQREIDLIQFRPLVPISQRDMNDETFELTPHETSGLLVGAFESFVASQDDIGIDALISIIQTGNPKNKYALIGLLM